MSLVSGHLLPDTDVPSGCWVLTEGLGVISLAGVALSGYSCSVWGLLLGITAFYVQCCHVLI